MVAVNKVGTCGNRVDIKGKQCDTCAKLRSFDIRWQAGHPGSGKQFHVGLVGGDSCRTLTGNYLMDV